MDRSRDRPRVSTEYTYRGIDAAFLENAHLRIMLLPGKGGDVLEFVDKRTDVNVLWRADHEWVAPTDRPVPTAGAGAWNDTYPGGWQVNLPVAGHAEDVAGTYGLHGESALLPWDVTEVRDDADAVGLTLEVDLVRYPFHVERTLTLPADEALLRIEESVTNEGGVELEYAWQQHVALGAPLVGPAARLDVPADRGVVEPYDESHPNNRLAPDEAFDWPRAPGLDGEEVDLQAFPDHDAEINDLAVATDLDDGWYAVTNPDLDLGFGLRFPTDPFECVWYWQSFGGAADSPFWNRNYTAAIEPTTSFPPGDASEGERPGRTPKTLEPGETVEATFEAVTYGGVAGVDSLGPGGDVTGT